MNHLKSRFLFLILGILASIMLIGCTAATTTEPTAVSATAVSATAVSAEPTTVTESVSPTEPVSTVVAEATAETVTEPTPTTAVGSQAIAYMQGQTLYIRPLEGGEAIPVDSCPNGTTCILRYFKWSPDGEHLLYYYYDSMDDSLRLSNRQGQVQTVSEDIGFVRPAAWSPDGRTIAFFRATETYIEGSETVPPAQVHEVWTAALGEDGTVGAPQLVGNVNMLPPGCGGGGRSQSEVLYENEGGTAYGYLMGVTEWTAQGILLYTTNCTNIGIGRFDLNSATELEPFPGDLRNLVLNDSRDRWYAVSGPYWSEDPADHQIVTGTPDSTEIQTIATSQPVELLFFGQTSGRLYYTVRQLVERAELTDRGLFFNFYNSALWTINVDGTAETMLYQAEDQAFASVTEQPDGSILFTRVENDRPLYEAAQDATLTDLSAYAPKRHIVQIGAAGGEPVVVIEDAGQPAVSPAP
jgi:hypothetical protein